MIIVGDFNTGRHYIDEDKATFYCSDYFDKLENIGLRDAWRAIHGYKREYSWYSNFGNGFRLDHFYVAKELVQSITDCYYLHECREKKISDHSMMILELSGDL